MNKQTLLNIVFIETLIILFAPFLLKIMGQVEWSWLIAALPLLIPCGLIALVFLYFSILNIVYGILGLIVRNKWIKLIKKTGFVLFDHRKIREQLKQNGEQERKHVAGMIMNVPRDLVMYDSSYLLHPIKEQEVQVMLVSDNAFDGGILTSPEKEHVLRKEIEHIRRFLKVCGVNYIVRRDILKTTS